MKKSLLDKVIVNLDGERFLLKGRSCEPLATLDDLRGGKWVITDFRGAPAFLTSVEAPARYAELMALRKLQEQGEAGQHSQVLTHWKRSRGANLTDIFFTVLDKATHTSYLEYAAADPAHHLIFPHSALLYGVLSKLAHKRNVAVLFDHGRHVDIILGQEGRVVGHSRLSTHSADPAEKASISEALQQELRSLASAGKVRLEEIVYFNWLVANENPDSGSTGGSISFGADEPTMATWGPGLKEEDATGGSGFSTGLSSSGKGVSDQLAHQLISADWVKQLADGMEIKHRILKAQRFDLPDSQFLVTSLPVVLNHLSHNLASNPPLDRIQYAAERNTKWAVIGFWLLVGLALVTQLYFTQENASLQQEISTVKSNLPTLEQVRPLNPTLPPEVDFARQLSSLFDMPSPRAVLVEISNALPADAAWHFKTVRYAYDAVMTPSITLSGRIGGGFEVAKGHFAAFISAMRSSGYRVVNETLTTNVQEIDFQVTLVRDDAVVESYVVLMPEDDGSVGQVIVSNEAGESIIDQAGMAVGMDDSDVAPSVPFVMDPEQINSVFGKALGIQPEPPVNFVFNFLSGTTELTQQSKQQLPEILQLIANRVAPRVEVVGHTDRAGGAERNTELGLERARIVAQYVRDAGVPGEAVEASSHGENNPVVPTADGVANSRNRRVELTVQ